MKHIKLSIIYKSNPDNIFTRISGNTARGHTFKLFKPRNNTTTARHHFFNSRVINYWPQWNNNPLRISVVSAKSTPTFKFKLDNYWNIIGHVHNQRPIAY